MSVELNLSRHIELFNPNEFDMPITVIGAGATGSWLVLSLAKLGLKNITVYDYDIVEEHNVPNQAFGLKDVGRPKVEVLYDMVLATTGTEIKAINGWFSNQRLTGVVFVMVDSMSARKKIWENSIKMKVAVELLVEPRMGIDGGRVYNVIPTNMTHIKKYEDTFYGDDVAEVSACGSSLTVISSALGITSWCIRQLINFSNDVELDNEILLDFKYNNIITTVWG